MMLTCTSILPPPCLRPPRPLHDGDTAPPSCCQRYCFHDDCNWDCTLDAVVFRFLPFPASIRWGEPSVLHFGECGVTHGADSASCQQAGEGPWLKEAGWQGSGGGTDGSTVNVLAEIVEAQGGDREVTRRWGRDEEWGGQGGWGDSRDALLCLHYTTMYSSDEIE